MGKSNPCPTSEITASGEKTKTTQDKIKAAPPASGTLNKTVQELERTV